MLNKTPKPTAASVTEADRVPKPYPSSPSFADHHRKVTVVCRVRPVPTSTAAAASTAVGSGGGPNTGSNCLLAAHPNVILTTTRKSVTGKLIAEHTKYNFDYVFGGGDGHQKECNDDEASDNADSHLAATTSVVDNALIYKTLQLTPHFVDVAMGQGASVAVAFGATGSGKTHTMTGSDGGNGTEKGLMPLAIGALFDQIAAAQAQFGWNYTVSFSAVEIAGRTVTDLLVSAARPSPTPYPCDVKEDDLGRAFVAHCVSIPVPSAADGFSLLQESAARRRTSSTFRNNTSSRTHAVFIFKIKNESLPLTDEGTMLFVDLAGSEAAYDKANHDASTLKETALINAALANLKDCLRARASISSSGAHVHIPYRSDKLTLLLKALFEPASSTPSATILCCCVSPLPSDAVHSSHSLKYIAPMKAALANAGRLAANPNDPSGWTAERVAAFLTEVSGNKLSPAAFAERPEGMTGKQLLMLTQQDFIRRCCQPTHNQNHTDTDGSITVDEAIHYFGELWELGSAARDTRRHQIERTAAIHKVMTKNSAEQEAQLMDSVAEEKAVYERYQRAKKSGDEATAAEIMKVMMGHAGAPRMAAGF